MTARQLIIELMKYDLDHKVAVKTGFTEIESGGEGSGVVVGYPAEVLKVWDDREVHIVCGQR